MTGLNLFRKTTFECSKVITQSYSTSFTLGIRALDKKFHEPVYAIYGFVRFADEIVDTFHQFEKLELLKRFRQDTLEAIENRISLNPVLYAFQDVVNQYQIDWELIDAFLTSMEMDLHRKTFNPEAYQNYIYGSAEVVGLMCLKVFCEGDQHLYHQLKEPARSLGSAFQKVNFLRDMKSDYFERGRIYFPGVDFSAFDLEIKQQIEADIQCDFDAGYKGILNLPKGARFGVYLAYIYYLRLFRKIKQCTAKTIMKERVRIPDQIKLMLVLFTYVRHRLNVL
jgi:phytoene/squalene synthetase